MQDPHQDITTQIYDSNAKNYKKQVEDFNFPWNMFEYFLDELEGKKILDIWCAFGREVKKLRDTWYEAYGIEISTWLIAEAEKDIQKYIHQWDINNLSDYYEQQEFDGIVSSASLVHMDIDCWVEVMKQIHNLLKDSWIFYISLKVDTQEKTFFKESISTPWCTKKYVYYGEKQIEEILIEIWFSILKTHIWKPASDSWKILICKK